MKKLQHVLDIQERERNNYSNFNRCCLFCRTAFQVNHFKYKSAVLVLISLFIFLLIAIETICLFILLIKKGVPHSKLFDHMAFEHNFSVGKPDNLVYVNALLDLLEEKLEKMVRQSCAILNFYPNKSSIYYFIPRTYAFVNELSIVNNFWLKL